MLIQNREQFDELLAAIQRNTLVCFDTETTIAQSAQDRVLLGTAFCVYEGGEFRTWYVPTGHRHLDKNPWLPDRNVPIDYLHEIPWEDSNREWIAFNAKFDIAVIENTIGKPIAGFVHDEQVNAHLIDENRFSFELDQLGRILFKERKKAIPKELQQKLGGWDYLPPSIMGPYAEQDVRLEFKLHHYNLPRLEEQSLTKLSRGPANRYVHTLKRVVETGLLVDLERCQQLSCEASEGMARREARLGFRPTDAQVRECLHGLKGRWRLPVREVTDTGAPSTSRDTLTRYQANAKAEGKDELVQIIDDIIGYRTLQKAKSTWYDGFQRYLDSQGRIHPGIKQHGTETGRLSQAAPSLHQIPRDGDRPGGVSIEVRSIFRAPEGYELWELDYSQIELRIACRRAEDKRMIDAYMNGEDLHHMTAELIGSYDYFPNTKEGRANGRQVGKRGNFLWIYRGSGNRLRIALWGDARMDIPTRQCDAWTAEFHRQYPGFNRIAAMAESAARSRGFIRMFNGRRRRFQYQKPRDAFNSLVQGDAGQILMYGMNSIDEEISRRSIASRMVNTVHDSIWFYVPSENREEELQRLSLLMRAKPERVFSPLPFEVDAKMMWSAE